MDNTLTNRFGTCQFATGMKTAQRTLFLSWTLTVIVSTLISITVAISSEQKLDHYNDVYGGKVKTSAPVIGVLAQVLRDYKRFTDVEHLFTASSYVKWIETSGAQVLPIMLNQNESYYRKVFQQTNGLLFTGGDNMLNPNKNTPMLVAARMLYKMAVEANNQGDYYPIWGTCLGLELLSVLQSNQNVLEDCNANDVVLNSTFKERGKLFAPSDYSYLSLGSDFSKTIMNVLESKNLTYHFHHKCLTDEGLEKTGMVDFFRPLAYANDTKGLKFINIIEAINYPFFAVQFHPEKPPFEFEIRNYQQKIPHSRESIAVSRYFADFFVMEAQKSDHKANASPKFKESLIYAHHPSYTALKNDMYEQRYLFPFKNNGLDTEEFLDHIPDDDEDIPEK